MEYADAKTYTAIATREGPGVPSGGEFTAHNQVQLVLGIVWRVQVVFGTVAIAMKRFPHIRPHADVAREATGVDGDGGGQADALPGVIPGGDALHTPIFSDGLL